MWILPHQLGIVEQKYRGLSSPFQGKVDTEMKERFCLWGKLEAQFPLGRTEPTVKETQPTHSLPRTHTPPQHTLTL